MFENGNIVFLHKIIEGSASRSYGIHVAKLAGVPQSLLERAQDKLSELENGAPQIVPAVLSGEEVHEPEVPAYQISKPAKKSAKPAVEGQISLFDFAPVSVVERLREIDLMEITPSQAFKILEELKESLDD